MSRDGGGGALRRAAEVRLRQRPVPPLPRAATPEEVEKLLDELLVHQIELELQNDELRSAQLALRASRDELAESEQRYRELYDAAPVGYLMLASDGRIEAANAAAATLLGARPDVLRGRRFSDFVTPERQDAWHHQRRALLRGRAARALAIELRSLDGGAFHVELAGTVARDDEGEARGLRIAMLDVTERDHAVQEVRESARRVRIMADALPVLVAYVGPDERYRFAYAAYEAWFGESAGAMQGRSVREVIGEAAYATLREQVAAALAGQSVHFKGEVEYRGVGRRYVKLAYAPDVADDGAVRGFYWVVHDLSELRAAEQALRAASAEAALAEHRERRRLADDLHDDVAQILSLASLQLRALPDAAEDEREALLQRVAKLVAEARERVGSLSFQLSPPMLHDVGLVAAAQWLAEDLARSYGIQVRIEAPTEIAALSEAVRVTLFRALRELLINVARHAGSGEARVRIRRAGDRVDVEVVDSGEGFDPLEVRRGFGLRAVRDRVEHMGGSVRVDSAPGRGTKVCVQIPMTSGEAAVS